LSLAVVGAALLLGGCYVSGDLLLDGDQAAHPLAEGTYVRDGDPAEAWRVILEADGWYDLERVYPNGTLGETQRLMLAPAGQAAGRAVYDAAVETDDGYAYGAIEVEGPRVFMAAPDCGDPLERNLAVDQGADASEDGSMTRACSFHGRSALLAALSAFAGQADFGRPFLRH
jgi:hypothetical protein